MKKTISLLAKLLPLSLSFIFSTYLYGKATVLLDAGHGGDDLGATFFIEKKDFDKKSMLPLRPIKEDSQLFYFAEKDLALEIGRMIADGLQSEGLKVFLSRTHDRTMTLKERAEIAEMVKADLVVSLHFNSSTRKEAHGFETYYLDHHKDTVVSKIEKAENHDQTGENFLEGTVQQILLDLLIDRMTPESKRLAENVHKQVMSKVKVMNMSDRHVRPGLFYILALSKTPAILVEGGFLSHPEEKKKVIKKDYAIKLSQGVSAGIINFLKEEHQRKIK